MVGDKESPNDEEIEILWEGLEQQFGASAAAEREKLRVFSGNPRYQKLLDKDVCLRGNGMTTSFGNARAGLLILRELQEKDPDMFLEFVRSVRPSGARSTPDATWQMAIARRKLQDRGFFLRDGLTPDPMFHAILDAAYAETAEGIVLRNPVVPPSREFIEEVIASEKEVDRQIVARRAELPGDDDDRSKGGSDKGGGPIR